MKGHFWLVVAATVVFWWYQYQEGIYYFTIHPGGRSAETISASVYRFVQDFAIYPSVVAIVIAHGLFVPRMPTSHRSDGTDHA